MATAAPPAEPQSKLVKKAMATALAYNTWDIEQIMSHRHSDSWTHVVPHSLGRPKLNNNEYRKYFAGVEPLFKNFTVYITDVVADEVQHKVVLRCNSTAQTVVGDYANEYVIIIKTSDDDRWVLEFTEFVDSAYSVEFFGRLRAAVAAKASADTSTL